jgi:hypothetical protein
MKARNASPEPERLVLRLEKVTGAEIAELARAAQAWYEM